MAEPSRQNACSSFAAVPKIKTTDQKLVTDAGKPFIMHVPYDAYPRAETEWFFGDTSLPVQNTDTSVDKTEYRLKSPSKEDQGHYKVVIRNKHGAAEAFIDLDVIGASDRCRFYYDNDNLKGLLNRKPVSLQMFLDQSKT